MEKKIEKNIFKVKKEFVCDKCVRLRRQRNIQEIFIIKKFKGERIKKIFFLSWPKRR